MSMYPENKLAKGMVQPGTDLVLFWLLMEKTKHAIMYLVLDLNICAEP